MSPAQLAPTTRILRPSRLMRGNATERLSVAEADRLIRSWIADGYPCPHAETERNPIVPT